VRLLDEGVEEPIENDGPADNGISLGTAGTYGVHVLGGPLFDDDTARLYIFDVTAQLFEADPATLGLSEVLVTGPPTIGGTAKWDHGVPDGVCDDAATSRLRDSALPPWRGERHTSSGGG